MCHFQSVQRILFRQDECVVPRRVGVYLGSGPCFGIDSCLPPRVEDGRLPAISLHVAFFDFQRQSQRAVVHAHAVAVDLPGAHAQCHGQVERHDVALRPSAFDADVLSGRVRGAQAFAVHLHGGVFGPGGDAQVEGEGHFLRGGETEGYFFFKRIVRFLRQCHGGVACHLCPGGAGGVEHGGQAAVGSRHHQVLGIIGPSLCMVVLAATAAEGVHGEEGAAVVDARVVVLRVAHGVVGRGDVAQRAEVGHHGRRVGVEGHFLAVVCPEGVSGDAQHDFVRSHLLYHAAGFHALARVDVAHACVFVGAEHAAGHLPEGAAYELVCVVRGTQLSRVFAQQIVSGRFAEALCDVYVVPVGQRRRLHPVGSVAVQLFDELRQRGVARAVV